MLTLALALALGPEPRRADPGDWDARHYALHLAIDPATKTIRGSVIVRARIGPRPLDRLFLDLEHTLTVDSVTSAGRRLDFDHTDDRLAVTRPRGWGRGERLEITIWYGGRPSGGLLFREHAGLPAVASYGLPYSARRWWPCKDSPADKAEEGAELAITVPRGLIVASNGRLMRHSVTADGNELYVWVESYPIYPDAMSVAVANYQEIDRYYRDGGADSMPVTFFVYPEDRAKAERDFAGLLDMLESHVASFGPYPFRREKYGVAEFPINSFREHQTLPSYGAPLLT
ncbi:MAG TPA: hypothetical protein VK688_11155, partial [Gemmatimonadales bacterium]|nr:hypothetical protein [Gemmatimonadales bacterium]